MTRNFDSSSEFQALFDGAPKLYLVLTPDLKIVAISDAYCQATYKNAEDVLGRGIFDVFPGSPDSQNATFIQNLQAALAAVLQTKHPHTLHRQRYDLLRPHQRGGGFEERYWEIFNTPVLDKAGKVLWIIHRVEDLTVFLRVDASTAGSLSSPLTAKAENSRAKQGAKEHGESFAKLEQRLVARSIELQTEILERKKTEAILHSENTFHNLVLDHMPAMVVVKDAENLRFVLINKAGEKLLGVDRTEYMGKSDHDFLPKEQADQNALLDRGILNSGKLHITEEDPVKTKQGDKRILRTLKMAVPDVDGRPKYLLVLSGDITERKLAERVLRESESRHRFLDALGKNTATCIEASDILSQTTRMLGEHLGVAICAYADMEQDEDHFTIRGDWSAQGSGSIVGYYSLSSFGRLAVRNLQAGQPLIIHDNRMELPAEEAAAFQNIGIAATVCVPLLRSGRLTALMAIHDRQPRTWSEYELSLLGEVTERSWAHIERVRSETLAREGARRLVQAQKMEAIGNLTGGMAHDFNNLLGIIIGNLDLLQSQSAADQSQDPNKVELVSDALEAALRGADLTERLLAFARRQPLRPQQIDVNHLVREVARLLSRTLGEDIEIILKLSEDTSTVNADPTQLEASLINIINNARDAMPTGGHLTIATKNRTLDAEYAALNAEVTPGNYTLIEITDTGTGMAPEILPQIFEPFFTTKEQGKGTGLGLSMVFGFMKQSAGHVTVYSEIGHGTTFRLYLPSSMSAAQTTEATSLLQPRGRETILAVEDDEKLRRVVVRQLNDLGYKVLEAENGASALQIIEKEDIDLLFTDIVMPGGMSGFDLANLAQKRSSRLKVVLTSGFPEAKSKGKSNPTEQTPILVKPYRKENLARAIRDALDAR